MTTKTTRLWTRATTRRAGDVEDGHRHEQGDGEDLHPGGVVAGERRAGVAPEREGDHRRDDAVRDVGQPGDDRRDVAVAEALVDVLEQATGGRELGTELGERVALQRGDAAGEQERQPDRRPGDLAGGAEQREDPGADHRGDADEGRLLGADVALGAGPRPSGARLRPPGPRPAARSARHARASPRANTTSAMIAATKRMATTQRNGPSMPVSSLRSGRARPGRSCSARRRGPCRARSPRS